MFKTIINKINIILLPALFVGLISIVAYSMITDKNLLGWGSVFIFDDVSGPEATVIVTAKQSARTAN